MCSIQYTVYSTQYTVYSIQYTVYSVQYTGHSIQYTVSCVLYTVYSTQYTVHSIQDTVYSVDDLHVHVTVMIGSTAFKIRDSVYLNRWIVGIIHSYFDFEGLRTHFVRSPSKSNCIVLYMYSRL